MGVPQSQYLTEYFELVGRTNISNGMILNASTGAVSEAFALASLRLSYCSSA